MQSAISIFHAPHNAELVQAGFYNPKVLNLEATSEPFPVQVTVRSKDYEDLIFREATAAAVLEDAKLVRDNIKL